jgi:hypothetical protein
MHDLLMRVSYADKSGTRLEYRRLNHTEIYAAIHYLEPDPRTEDKQDANDQDDQDKDNGVVICVCLYILVLGCLAFVWFYWR